MTNLHLLEDNLGSQRNGESDEEYKQWYHFPAICLKNTYLTVGLLRQKCEQSFLLEFEKKMLLWLRLPQLARQCRSQQWPPCHRQSCESE